MNDVMGIINAVGNQYSLQDLTQHRPLAAVPFGGRYRLVDFALSGMYNSGITNIGLLTPGYQRSMVDHMRLGASRYESGTVNNAMLLPLGHRQLSGGQSEEVAGFYGNLDYIQRSRQNYIVITPAGMVGNFDFRDAVKHHRNTGADATLLYNKQPPEEYDCDNHTNLAIDSDGQVVGMGVGRSESDKGDCFLGAFVLRKDLLSSLIAECYHNGCESLIEGMVRKAADLHIQAYHYQGYLARVHCLSSYYRHNMALLTPEVWQTLFGQSARIHTKIKEEPPAKYGMKAEVSRAVIASGCSIRGAVDHSVLFRQVTVEKGAAIKNSILMSNTRISEGATLEYVICDKGVQVGPGKQLRGQPNQPLLIRKGTVI